MMEEQDTPLYYYYYYCVSLYGCFGTSIFIFYLLVTH